MDITRSRRTRTALAAVALCAAAVGARAEVAKASPTGFQLVYRAEVQATPAHVWRTLIQLPSWWSDRHTYSGQASNMSFDAQAGGCWCERWADGRSVEHGRVVLVLPERTLRVFASLGPLQELAVQGVWTHTLTATDGKTVLQAGYRVAGDADAALDKLAPVVDRVMGEQFRRLKAMAENGRPE